jgi:hypothetical protein
MDEHTTEKWREVMDKLDSTLDCLRRIACSLESRGSRMIQPLYSMPDEDLGNFDYPDNLNNLHVSNEKLF